MTEFQELVKDAPEFASMEHGELVIYAYAMYAAGAKMDVENAKLRELCADLYAEMITYSSAPNYNASVWTQKLRELGVKVD